MEDLLVAVVFIFAGTWYMVIGTALLFEKSAAWYHQFNAWLRTLLIGEKYKRREREQPGAKVFLGLAYIFIGLCVLGIVYLKLTYEGG